MQGAVQAKAKDAGIRNVPQPEKGYGGEEGTMTKKKAHRGRQGREGRAKKQLGGKILRWTAEGD